MPRGSDGVGDAGGEDRDAATAPSAPTSVTAEVERDGLWELGFALGPPPDLERTRTLQGRAAALAETLEKLPLVVWSEAERDLLRGGDRERRRLFDRALLLLEPASVAAEAEHARAWRQKRRLLAGVSASAAELAAWNELLAPHLVRRAAARAALARELEAAANAALQAAGADLPPIRLAYSPSPREAADSPAATEAALAAREGEERRRGSPLAGPHRDRVAIELGGSGTRRHASAGEQKIVALALLAALERRLAARGRAPLVLLDDFESELDGPRAALAGALFAPALQVVSTSTRRAEKERFPAVRWRLENGEINRVKSDI